MFFNTVCASYVEISLDTAMGQKIAYISFLMLQPPLLLKLLINLPALYRRKKIEPTSFTDVFVVTS